MSQNKVKDAKLASDKKEQTHRKIELHFFYSKKPNGQLGLRKKYVYVDK